MLRNPRKRGKKPCRIKKNDVSSENFARNEACKQSAVQNDSQFVDDSCASVFYVTEGLSGEVTSCDLVSHELQFFCLHCIGDQTDEYDVSLVCLVCWKWSSHAYVWIWCFTKKSSDAFSKFRNHYQVTSCLKCCLEHLCFPEVEYSDYYKPNKSQKQPVASGIKLQHAEF